MTNLILFVLATVGLTNILIYGSIFDGVRSFLDDVLPKKLSSMLKCYQCLGTWVGFLTGYAILTHEFLGVLMCGFAGSCVSHFASKVEDYLDNTILNQGVELDDRAILNEGVDLDG